MAGKIFVNYRRDDVPGDARGVRDGLTARFGKSSVFMDVDNLLVGQRFDIELAKALDACDTLIAVIGPRWMELLRERTARGERDYVREEISAALVRKITVIPVRVGREGNMPPLPRPDELPEDIRDLVLHQKLDVAHERFGRDMAELIEGIVAVRKASSAGYPPNGSAVMPLGWIGVGVAVVIAIGYFAAAPLGIPTWTTRQSAKIATDDLAAQRADTEQLNHTQLPTEGTNAEVTTSSPPPNFDKTAHEEANTNTFQQAIPQPAPPTTVTPADAGWEASPFWRLAKEEFPQWYADRVRETGEMKAASKSEADIDRRLVEQIVVLRRQNAPKALSASLEHLKEIAEAFVANLGAMRSQSVDACYDFIEKGEVTSAAAALIRKPSEGAPLHDQLKAVFAAVIDGQNNPITRSAPQAADYNLVAAELGSIGWSQTDIQLFANPKELAAAPRDRVCKMVKEWFSAHLSVKDEPARERLLHETLRLVIAG